MQKYILGVIFILMLMCSSIAKVDAAWYPPDAPDQIKNAPISFIYRGIVKIEAYWIDDNQYIHEELGTGLSLGVKRGQFYVMTAGHIIKHRAHGQATIIKVSLFAAPRVTYDATFFQADLNSDFGVIALNISPIDSNDFDRVVKIAVDKNFPFSTGTNLSAIGHTLGKTWVNTNTTIKAYRNGLVELDRQQITNGNSGGPILNQYNQMVGMVTSIGGDKAYALPVNQVLQILENWQIPYRQQLSSGFVNNLLTIIRAVREVDEEALMTGERKTYFYEFRKTNVALFDKTKAAWIGWRRDDNFYVELIGDYYGNRNQLDEAWRILVREVFRYLPSDFKKVKQDGYTVVFWYFKVFKGTIHVRIEEFSGRLYLMVLKNDPADTKSKDVHIGLIYKYYSYIDDFLSDTYY